MRQEMRAGCRVDDDKSRQKQLGQPRTNDLNGEFVQTRHQVSTTNVTHTRAHITTTGTTTL